MNTLHSYRRDYSHRRNERVGAKSKNELHAAQDNLTKLLKTRTNVRKSPRLNFCLGRQAPVHLIPIIQLTLFSIYAIYVVIYLSVHLSFQELIETIDA
jgi:hypothetical protein